MSLTLREYEARRQHEIKVTKALNTPSNWFLSREFSFDHCRCCNGHISVTHLRYKLKGQLLKELKLNKWAPGKICIECFAEWETTPDTPLRELNRYNKFDLPL